MSTEPYFQDHDVTLYQGDAAETLANLEPGSVNCIVTSPPYFGLRDYGVDGQLGLEASPVEYVEKLADTLDVAGDVLANDGVMWLNLGDTYSTRVAVRTSSHQDGLNGADYAKDWIRDKAKGLTRMPTFLPEKNLMGIPWRVAFAMQDRGWTLRNAVIWNKPNAMPESVTDRLSSRYEHVFLFSKSRKYWFDLGPIREEHAYPGKSRTRGAGSLGIRHVTEADVHTQYDGNEAGKNPGDVWTVATSPFAGAHFATMPPELVKRCILSGCPAGGVVLDPFTGSGTTGMVARQLGRKFVGIELNPEYCDIAVKRIGDPVLDFAAASLSGETQPEGENR